MNYSHAHVRTSHNISCKASAEYNVNLQNIMRKSVSPDFHVMCVGKPQVSALRMHSTMCAAITGYHTPQCAPQRRSDNAHTQRTTHYQHRARYAWQALQQSTVKFDPQRFGFGKINYAELAYELRVWPFVLYTKRPWVRV